MIETAYCFLLAVSHHKHAELSEEPGGNEEQHDYWLFIVTAHARQTFSLEVDLCQLISRGESNVMMKGCPLAPFLAQFLFPYPTSANSGRHRPKSDRYRANVDRPQFARSRPAIDPTRQNSAEIAPTMAEIGPKLIELAANVAQIGRNRPKSVRRSWSPSAQSCPNSAELGPTLVYQRVVSI